MARAATNVDYEDLLAAAAINGVAIAILTLGIYFPRHQRRDLFLAFIGVNAGLFTVATFISETDINLAAGLGLFALLSVVRLRSSEIAQEEIGYYFVALVLGLINGFAPDGEWKRTITLDTMLLVVMYVADHPRLFAAYRQQHITLDAVFPDEAALRAKVEQLLAGKVTRITVLRTDYVHEHTVVDVRYRAGKAPPREVPDVPA